VCGDFCRFVPTGVIVVIVVGLAMTLGGNNDPFDDDARRVKGGVAVAFGSPIVMFSVVSGLGE